MQRCRCAARFVCVRGQADGTCDSQLWNGSADEQRRRFVRGEERRVRDRHTRAGKEVRSSEQAQ